jgi:hypothetical protein
MELLLDMVNQNIQGELKKFQDNIRSRANTARGLDFEHMIKALAHKGGVGIGKTPKKLVSICCP